MSDTPVDTSKRTWLIASTCAGAVGGIAVAVPFVSTFQPSEKAKAAGAAVGLADAAGKGPCTRTRTRTSTNHNSNTSSRNRIPQSTFETLTCRIAARQPSIRSKPQRMKRDRNEMLHIGETGRPYTRASQCTPKHSLSSPQTTARPRLLKNNNTRTHTHTHPHTHLPASASTQQPLAHPGARDTDVFKLT